MRLLTVSILFLITINAQAHSAAAQDTPKARQPLLLGLSDSYGIELAWNAILTEAGIAFEKIPMPHRRRRRMFLEGEIVLDCCVIPEWRNTPEENAIQLYSDVVYQSAEHYIFRKGNGVNITSPEQLLTMRVATIEGFNYVLEEFFGAKVPVRDIRAVLQMVESGRAQTAIISKMDFIRYTAQQPRNIELGNMHSSVSLRARIHKKRADLLLPINKAIQTLKARGTLTKLAETPEPASE